MQDAATEFIYTQVEQFQWSSIAVACGLTVYFIMFTLILIHIEVVKPINELSDHIQSPQDADKVARFIAKLRRREFEKNFARETMIKKAEKIRKRK